MAVMIFIIIKVIVVVDSQNGVAAFSAGLRCMHFLVLPLVGISSAVVTVTGAAFGANDKEKMQTVFAYSLKLGIVIACLMVTATFLLADIITLMFTWSNNSKAISSDLTWFLRLVFWGHPALVIAMNAASLFIGVGKGIKAFLLVLFRTIFFTVPLVLLLGIGFDLGLNGIWTGMVIANWLTAFVALIWVNRFFKTRCFPATNTDGEHDRVKLNLQKTG
ncbi:MAG: hypothetical protein GY729_20005 [Desulfobacteraceae bacterium]|nr:hypothetical protein [Desulfobacteraceae bacterium]